MVLDSGEVFMDQVEGERVGSSRSQLEPEVRVDPPRTPSRRSNVAKKEKEKMSQNGLPAQTNQAVQRRSSSSSSSLKCGATPRPPLRRPLSLEVTPQRLRGSQEQMADRRIVQPPWRSGSAAPSPPARSLTSPSLGAGGWMRRSESTCSVNYSLGLRAGRGQMRPATSLPHIAKGVGVGGRSLPTPSRPCLLVALRPLNLDQEKQTFFQSDYKYEPQFEYAQPEPRSVLEKYREGSGLFLEQ
ncbi:uncharacterized protein KIAA0895-like, partial [Plectropomus leopardus]|uniref:uncharacterized protein KIAA0895-like n=1 Tax=Plectropomus leopardus TaxID=160734 RepID=UPI001C4BC2F1